MTEELKQNIQLVLSCSQLKSKDAFSKSDPFAVVYLKTQPVNNADQGTWQRIARTETVEDNLNPVWKELISLEFHFEQMQKIRVEIYDRDNESEDFKQQKFLGCYETSLSSIMGARGCKVNAPLKNKKGKDSKKSRIEIVGEIQSTTKKIVEFQFKAEKLDRKNFLGLGKSDPFFEILQQAADGRFIPVMRSEYIKAELNPTWKPARISLKKLCNGDEERQIMVKVFDYNSMGDPNFIGHTIVTAKEMITQGSFDLKSSSGKKAGKLITTQGAILDGFSFLDYIQSGCELKLSVAIDFTLSNGDPSTPGSLHSRNTGFQYTPGYVSGDNLNEYQKAIVAITQILESYDSDRMIPVYGFGGNVQSFDMHCFPLTLDAGNPEVFGTEGVLNVYQSAIQKVPLYGPTFFGPVLKEAKKQAKKAAKEHQSYSILLIITDGEIFDMDLTIKRLIKGSNLPMSVIIVGVGNADFSKMEALDGDGGVLTQGGNVALRDIVQFVPFTKFKTKSFTALAEETLKEIPTQLEDYFNYKGIKPLNHQF